MIDPDPEAGGTGAMPDGRAPSIRTLLLVLLAAALLPVAATAAWFLAYELDEARESAEGRVTLLARGVAAALQLTLRDHQAVMQRLAERPRVRALDPNDFDPGVAEYVRVHPEFNTLTVRDREARAVYSSRPNPATPEQFGQFPWFKAGIASDGFRASDVFQGTLTGRWVTVLTQPVRDASGAVGGLMSLSLDLLHLNERVLGDVPRDALVAVTDRQDRYVLRSADPQTWLGKSAPLKFVEGTAGEREGFRMGVGPDGVSRLYSFVTLPDTGWRVVAGLPEDEVYANYRTLRTRGLVVGGGTLLLALLAAWWIGRDIVKPIRGLSGAAASVAQGNAQALAPVSGPVEIRQVAEQFNRMVQARAQVEAALRRSEKNLEITLQSIGDAVIATDLAGRVSRMNPTAEQMTGWSLGDARGRSLDEVFRIVNSSTRQPAADPVQQVLRTGAVVGLANHTALLARDGAEYQIADSAAPIRDDAGQTVGVVLVFSDVTERYRAEQALRSSAEVLRQRDRALAEISQGVMMTDPQARIIYVNPGFERLTGYRTDEVLGRTARFLQGEATAPDVAAGISRAVRAGEGFHGEILNYRKDGTPFWAVLDISPLRDEQGTLTGFVGAQRDVTERKQAEAARSDLEAQLRESQKMESIGTLAGGIAHDFNNVLGAVLGNVALARDELGPEHPASQNLDQIHRASLRARDLVQQILTFSRRQRQALVVQPLRPIVEETLALLRAGLPAMTQLQSAMADEPLYVDADGTQIQQVLMNLGTNAWHALHGSSGLIEVGLDEQRFTAASALRMGTVSAGRYAHLWVRDNGAGMDRLTLERMFEPFFTTKAIGDGTGLGLAVVHGIVLAHGGAIDVDSALGRGTTVHVYLPACDAPPAPPPESVRPGMTGLGQGEHVLYVDDDEVMRLMVERLLQRAGWRVTVASAASEALEVLAATPGAFDIVVTDYSMQGASGLELARQLQGQRPDLPVVITSGFISDELRRDAAQAGVRHLVPKQDLFDELARAVSQALSRRTAGKGA